MLSTGIFNLLHRSLLKRFSLLIWLVCRSLQCLISSLTQAGGGGLLFGLLVPLRCGEGLVLLSSLRCSGSRLFYMERALRCTWFQPSGVPQKPGTKSCACFLCLPRQSGSGSQELDGRTLPGAAHLLLSAAHLLPSAAPATVPTRAGRVPAPCVSLRPSRQMSTFQNLRRSLIRNWRPVCSAVGAAVLGAEPAPFPSPCLQSPAGLGRSVACLRALLWT